MLGDVSQILTASKAHISNASLKTHDDLSAILQMSIQIESTSQLSSILARISHLPNIVEVKRKV
ncbi:ACT domain-containing protein [Methylomonas sp. UP202]|uniref:ACT domain-containing protein n=1 Tax=Methylomonas sp. UP202 TaxID=3040943 RepID=UPI00247A07F8|nr:ACT domain-containing protein [Methylomonas sp. UP202]WGS84865.1 hypothetical protein QC632_17655 [Methylomonas sp. UP202]